jgi:hypothetical protein
MAARLVALAVAAIVAAAPVALTACELMCAASDRAASQASAHACHEIEPGQNGGPAIAASPHACGHVAVLPSAAKFTGTSLEACIPATRAGSLIRAIATEVGLVAHGPPPRSLHAARLTPLRI